MNKVIKLWLVSLLIIGCADEPIEKKIINNEKESTGKFVDEWTFSVDPKAEDNFEYAAFRLWVPTTSEVKATLILLSSYNSDALDLAHSAYWQEYANNQGLALLGIHFNSSPNAEEQYSNAKSGSGKALLFALDTLTQKHNIPNIATLPFLIRGYSAGGVFSYNFADFVPKRVVAFSNIRGGLLEETSIASKTVPGLMIIGDADAAQSISRIKEIVIDKRIKGGLWGYAIAPNENHSSDLFKSDQLTKDFFTVALSMRLSSGTDVLFSIAEISGWLGNHTTNKVYSYDEYQEAKYAASWLINGEVASKWKTFQMK